MNGISDRLIIGYDMSGDDQASLIVARKHGRGLHIINEFQGTEAEKLYEKLSEWGNNSNGKEKDHGDNELFDND